VRSGFKKGAVRSTSDLPFGSEFSPAQICLPRLLELSAEFGGNWHNFEAAVRDEYFRSPNRDEYNQKKLANNTKLSMQAYRIIDESARLTEFGETLFSLRDDPVAIENTLARHILHNLNGLTLVQCILDMQAAGETVNLVSLREWLAERGVRLARGTKHVSTMRLWLERCGVFVAGGNWRVDRRRLEEIVGAKDEDLEALAGLSREQRLFLKALVNIGEPGPFPSNEVEKLARASYGVKFNEKSLPKDVLYPLRDAGFIEIIRQTTGRGAKPSLVAPTERLTAEVLLPILDQLDKQVLSELRPYLRRPLTDIFAELDSDSRHVAGLALEALAIRLMRLIDLQYTATRLRGAATGGAEVDVIFESDRLVFSRWQVQCKNTSRISLEDVAKEVGLTHMIKSTVIVMVGTGVVGPEARRYANRIMRDSSLSIAMVDKNDLANIISNPPAIVDVLTREARHAMDLKKLEMD
jgi:site-specific DNA-methyltransferase (cytosine-N4-specific)